MDQELMSEIEGMIDSVGDEGIRSHVAKAAKYVGDRSRRLIVANGIARAREGGYGELASRLAHLAHGESPDDPILLLEMCSSLGDPQQTVTEIEKYRERVDLDSLPQDQREKMAVALAEAYKNTGRVSESVQLLEGLNSELARAVELLAGQYFETGELQKTIDLLYERIKYVGRLTPEMASWMAKSFDALADYSQAYEKLAQFQDDPAVKPIFDKARAEMGFPVEDEVVGRLPFDHPQPDDFQRDRAEEDLSSLL